MIQEATAGGQCPKSSDASCKCPGGAIKVIVLVSYVCLPFGIWFLASGICHAANVQMRKDHSIVVCIGFPSLFAIGHLVLSIWYLQMFQMSRMRQGYLFQRAISADL